MVLLHLRRYRGYRGVPVASAETCRRTGRGNAVAKTLSTVFLMNLDDNYVEELRERWLEFKSRRSKR
ncbi:unnamed protein product [Boreogadus saida]